MRLGIIADDFTGATDIAGFLVANGLSTIQLNGVPDKALQVEADAVVISLKSRSCPVDEAISMSLQALDWLVAAELRAVLLQILLDIRQHVEGQYRPGHRRPARCAG